MKLRLSVVIILCVPFGSVEMPTGVEVEVHIIEIVIELTIETTIELSIKMNII